MAFLWFPLLLSVAGLAWLAHDTGALMLAWLTDKPLPLPERDGASLMSLWIIVAFLGLVLGGLVAWKWLPGGTGQRGVSKVSAASLVAKSRDQQR